MTGDRERCRQARVPDTVGFATKPQLATAMLSEALDAGVPCRWITGDSVHGNAELFAALQERGKNHVLAVASNRCRSRFDTETVGAIAKGLRPDDWRTVAVGDGAKGPKRFDWALVVDHQGPSRQWG